MHRSYINPWNFHYMVKPLASQVPHAHTHHSLHFLVHTTVATISPTLVLVYSTVSCHALLEGIQPIKWQQLENITVQTLTKLRDVRVNISERLEMSTSTRTRSESERSIPHRSSFQSTLKVTAYQEHLAQSLTEKNHQLSTPAEW
jgi:hypothetical protein